MSGRRLVSIVLPTHNGERYLASAIESVLAQTYSEWELLLVDDASTDRTSEIARGAAAKDGRIRTIRHDTNRKLPSALNTGFEAARGAYLGWTSDDNLYRPEAIETMVRFLDGHEEIGMVYADYSTIDAEGRVTGHVRAFPPECLAYLNAVGPCMLYRRAVLEVVGGYATDVFTAEDYEYWIRVAGRFRIEPLHEDLYLYRFHGDSLTSLEQERIRHATAAVLGRHLDGMTWAGRAPRARGHLMLADLARRRGDRSEVLRRWIRAAILSPTLVGDRIVRKVLRSARVA
jgi:glycosyltransferase involved in cell wall biosynthesis